ncbi:MAG: hypothetical protein C5B59_12920 [Bacteroidetes bacterium]|nr:MAG: hypothetical protein C5B59_12920 [Bacteroidota bacterium]
MLVKIIKDFHPAEGYQVGQIVGMTDVETLIREGYVVPAEEVVETEPEPVTAEPTVEPQVEQAPVQEEVTSEEAHE